jgi:hypothetical protein
MRLRVSGFVFEQIDQFADLAAKEGTRTGQGCCVTSAANTV